MAKTSKGKPTKKVPSKQSKTDSKKPASKTKSSVKTAPKKSIRKRPVKKVVRVPMVGIGASAGGLEPFERFFDAMPVNSGIAFVVIQHLSPDFESMMDELLSRHSSMDIKRVVDDLPVQPNTIYLNPPRSQMIVENGRFKLTANPDTRQLNLPIDIFFESMAKEYGRQALAIVLSGTGSDGTRGVAAIKENEGWVLVQSPSSSKFDGMPRSVIESGNFDAIATPSDMPTLIKRVRAGKSINQDYAGDVSDDPAQHIFYRLRDKFGTDFGYYKDATIRRRFERRAQLCGLELEAYAIRLETDADELDALYADLLIDVTSFFRDLKAYASVKTLAIDKLAEKMTHDNQIRVWVAGCSSGEEAYSIAIYFAEYARENNIPLNLKILATDVHQRSLGAAAEGIYSKMSLKGLSNDQIARYFEKNVDYYQVNQQIRRLVVFSKHNLLRDPPFTRIDLVTCRNVMIYFREEAQQKTLALFHFSLKVGGYLFLGPSETLGRLDEEFELLDRRWKIHRKKRDVRLIEATSLLPRDSSQKSRKDYQVPFLTGRTGTLQRFKQAHGDALEVMLKKYAPPGFLLNRNGEVAHVFGTAGKFVKIDGGAFSNRIIDLVDPNLRLAITAGLERLIAGEKSTFERRVIITGENGDDDQSIIVGLTALSEIGGAGGHYLLTLITARAKSLPSGSNAKFLDTSETAQILQNRIRDLERDLTSTEESLQSMVEELQTSNEELQATNEELMASNEELQSTNEELHSVNEELYTVSAEHQRKIDELTVLTDDMNQLLKSINIGIIFLGKDLNIRRFTPSATEVFNLLDQDVGRPFAHTTYRFEGLDLNAIMNTVQQTKTSKMYEIGVDGKEYIMRILPYETSMINHDETEQAGIVITVVDVTQLKQAERERIADKEIYETVLNDLNESVMRFDLSDQTILMCNQAFAKNHNKKPKKLIGLTLEKAMDKALAKQTFKEISTLKAGEVIKSQIVIKDKNKQNRFIARNIRMIGDEKGEPVAAQITGLDVTEEYRYTQALESMINIERLAVGNIQKALEEIVKIGCDYLELPSGVIAKVSDNNYTVHYRYGKLPRSIKYSQTAPYDKTIAYHLPKGSYPVGISNMGRSHLKNETCYDYIGVETYIGIRTTVLGKNFGVLSFAASAARNREFSDMEKTIIRLLGRMVGLILDREAHIKNLSARTDELESVNEGLNRFTYLASHDLQEPLRKIQQSGELLQMDAGEGLDEEGQYFLKIMIESSGRMRSLIDDLLLYSTTAHLELDKEKIQFNSLINEAIEVLGTKVDESKAKFNASKLPIVACDVKVTKQILVNLFSNSIKYRQDGLAPNIRITSRRKKMTTVLSFKDNGIGMHIDENINIFEPFVRLHSKSEYSGSGIGLAICKSICERHGWTIDYKSKLGAGTEVLIEIPNRDVS